MNLLGVGIAAVILLGTMWCVLRAGALADKRSEAAKQETWCELNEVWVSECHVESTDTCPYFDICTIRRN